MLRIIFNCRKRNKACNDLFYLNMQLVPRSAVSVSDFDDGPIKVKVNEGLLCLPPLSSYKLPSLENDMNFTF